MNADDHPFIDFLARGYGIKSVPGDGLELGRVYYKLTDPKLFFYREAYLGNFLEVK